YFNSRLKDEIFTTFPPPDFIASPANRTTASPQRGVEIYARARIGSGWSIDAAYTYLHAREAGAEEVRRAKHIASLTVDWRLPADRGALNLVARYNGRQSDVAFTDPSFIPVPVRLDDYLLINLAGDLRLTKRVEAFARVENLLDDQYEEVFSFVAPGRSTYAGLRLRI